jgi:2-iminobutanoate/2-iminopropanoate deaminase
MKRLSWIALVVVSLGMGWALAQQLPFSAARTAGDTLYVSGQIPMKADGTLESGSTTAQTRQVMENMGKVLKEEGYTFDDVVKVTVYLKSMDDYQEMNAAYREFFSGDFPARECVGGLEIAAGLDVEISAIAYKAR